MTAKLREITDNTGPTTGAAPRHKRPPAASAARRKRWRRAASPWRHLRDPRLHLPLLVVLTALALLFAWQVRRPFTLDVGGPDDAPYLAGVHAGEAVDADPAGIRPTFRWTQRATTVTIPGYGATRATLTVRMQGARPGETTPPSVQISVGNGAPQSVALASEMRDYEFPVDPGAFRDGALRVTISAPTFRPRGDARDLGVPLDRVALHDTGGAGGLVAPPVAVLALAILAILAAYTVVSVLLASPLSGLAAGSVTSLAIIGCVLGPRFIFAMYAPGLAWIVAIVAPVTLLVGWAAWRLGDHFAWPASRRALGGAALIAGAHLFTLIAGMRHPQFRSSDLMLNVHRLEFVQRGDWIFTLPLPGERAIEAPYPPLFYAVMLPLAGFVRDSALLVEATASVALAAGALLTFALARRVTDDDGAALMAAGICSVLPIAYGMASAGNFANLFGQGVATLALVLLALTWGRWDRAPVALGLTTALTLALLGHFGIFLSLLVAVPLFVAVAAFVPNGRRQALALACSFALALAIAWALYYRFHSALLLGHARDFLGGDLNARGSAEPVSVAQRARNLWGGLLLWWGWPALPLALAGVNLLRRVRPSPQLWLTLAWLGSAVIFALGELAAGLSVRFHLFVGPALAVAAGWALWQLWRSHRLIGPAASLLVAGFWLWQSLTFWTDRILHAYH